MERRISSTTLKNCGGFDRISYPPLWKAAVDPLDFQAVLSIMRKPSVFRTKWEMLTRYVPGFLERLH